MAKYYYIDANNMRQGPVTRERLVELGVTAVTKVWHCELDVWCRAVDIPELHDMFIGEYHHMYMPAAQNTQLDDIVTYMDASEDIIPQCEPVKDINTESDLDENELVSESDEGLLQLLANDEVMSEFVPNRPNGFLMSLVTFSAYVILIDGIVMKSEVDSIREFLTDTFGHTTCEEYMGVLNRILCRIDTMPREEKFTKLRCLCQGVAKTISPSDCSLIVEYLEQLAMSDKYESSEEILLLDNICKWMGLSHKK